MLVHIEDRYTEIPLRVDMANGSAHQAGYKLCRRIKAARASGNRGDLNKLLENLKKDIKKHCSYICKEQAVELGEPEPGKTSPSGNHGSVNRSLSPFSSDNEKLYYNGTHLSATLPSRDSRSITEDRDTSSASSLVERSEELFPPAAESRSSSSAETAPNVEASDMSVYSEMLYSHASTTHIKLQVIPATAKSPEGWRVTIKYGDIEKTAVADTKKKAQHLAAHLVCQELGLVG